MAVTSSADHAATVLTLAAFKAWALADGNPDAEWHITRSTARVLADRATKLEAELAEWRNSIASEKLRWRAEEAEARAAELERERDELLIARRIAYSRTREAEALATELEREVIEADTHAGEWVQRAERAETALRRIASPDELTGDGPLEPILADPHGAAERELKARMDIARAALGETASPEGTAT